LGAQMRFAFESLRVLNPLTVGQFESKGGLKGLEATFLRDRVRETARISRIPEALVRELLLQLLAGDYEHPKTVARPRAALAQSVVAKAQADRLVAPDAAAIELAIDDLVRKRLLRVRIEPESNDHMIVLAHDYLARGVIELHRQANQWTELLREGHARF